MSDAAIKTDPKAGEKSLPVEAARYLYDMREKAYYDYKSGMYSARLDERMKNARNLLRNGVSVDIVKKSLGLSDEDLKKYLS